MAQDRPIHLLILTVAGWSVGRLQPEVCWCTCSKVTLIVNNCVSFSAGLALISSLPKVLCFKLIILGLGSNSPLKFCNNYDLL